MSEGAGAPQEETDSVAKKGFLEKVKDNSGKKVAITASALALGSVAMVAESGCEKVDGVETKQAAIERLEQDKTLRQEDKEYLEGLYNLIFKTDYNQALLDVPQSGSRMADLYEITYLFIKNNPRDEQFISGAQEVENKAETLGAYGRNHYVNAPMTISTNRDEFEEIIAPIKERCENGETLSNGKIFDQEELRMRSAIIEDILNNNRIDPLDPPDASMAAEIIQMIRMSDDSISDIVKRKEHSWEPSFSTDDEGNTRVSFVDKNGERVHYKADIS